MSSILFSESKGGVRNPIRDLTQNLGGASSASAAATASRDSFASRNTRRHLDRSDPLRLDPWEEYDMSNAWRDATVKDDSVKLPEEVIQRIDYDFKGAMKLYKDSLVRYHSLDYLFIGNRVDEINTVLNGIKALDNKQYHINSSEGATDAAISREDLLSLHRKLRAQAIKEVELAKKGLLDYNATELSNWIAKLLRGEDIFIEENEVYFNIESYGDEIKLVYVLRYLGMEGYLDAENNVSQKIRDVIDQVSSEEPYYELSPLENYLIEKGDIFNYMEIIEELSKGRVLPGAHHAIILYYYLKTRMDHFTSANLDSLILDKVLTSDPLEFKDVVDIYHAPVYSDPRKWSEFFIQTYRYVKKARVFIPHHIFVDIPDRVYLPESFNIDEEIRKIKALNDPPGKFSPLILILEELKKHKNITYLPSTKSKL